MTDNGQRPYLSAPDRAELPALTGVRAVAAISVVCWHSSGLNSGPQFPFTHAYLGVDLFFILSGFVISYVYWDDFARRGLAAYPRFVALRVARLWPAHMAMVAVFIGLAAAATFLAGRPFPTDLVIEELPLHLLLIHNWGLIEQTRINFPSWSVSAEFFAYLLFPAYVAAFRHLRAGWAVLTAIVVAMLLCWIGITLIFSGALGFTGPIAQIRVVCEFGIGVALFRLWQGRHFANLPWTGVSAVAIAAIAALTATTEPWHFLDYAIVLLMAPLVLGLAYGAGPLARLLACRPVVYLGEISYSIYLVHALVIFAIEWVLKRLDWAGAPATWAGWSLVGLTMLTCIASGAVLFHLVEKPARFALRRLIDRRIPDAIGAER